MSQQNPIIEVFQKTLMFMFISGLCIVSWNICNFLLFRFFGFRYYGFTVPSMLFGWCFFFPLAAPFCVLLMQNPEFANRGYGAANMVGDFPVGLFFFSLFLFTATMVFLRFEASHYRGEI